MWRPLKLIVIYKGDDKFPLSSASSIRSEGSPCHMLDIRGEKILHLLQINKTRVRTRVI